jgi:hypothetical protein
MRGSLKAQSVLKRVMLRLGAEFPKPPGNKRTMRFVAPRKRLCRFILLYTGVFLCVNKNCWMAVILRFQEGRYGLCRKVLFESFFDAVSYWFFDTRLAEISPKIEICDRSG